MSDDIRTANCDPALMCVAIPRATAILRRSVLAQLTRVRLTLFVKTVSGEKISDTMQRLTVCNAESNIDTAKEWIVENWKWIAIGVGAAIGTYILYSLFKRCCCDSSKQVADSTEMAPR